MHNMRLSLNSYRNISNSDFSSRPAKFVTTLHTLNRGGKTGSFETLHGL